MDQVSYVIFSLTMICAALCVIFYISWRAFGYPRHALTWSVSFALATLQWGLNMSQTLNFGLPTLLYWGLVNLLGPAVPALGIAGYQQRANVYVNTPVLIGLVLLSLCTTLWFTVGQPHVGLRYAILPFVTVITSLWTAWVVYDVPRPKKAIEKTLITLYLLIALVEAVIGLIVISQGAEADTDVLNLYSMVLFLALPVIFSVAGIMALATLASDLADRVAEAADEQIKAQQKETQQSWNTLHDAIEAIPDLVALDDGHGNIVTCNSAFADFVKLPQEKLSGIRSIELMELYWQKIETINGQKVSSAQDLANKMWWSLTTGEQMDAVTKDKKNFIVDCGYIEGGGFILVGRDVTQLANTRIRLETAIHAAPIAFAFYDNEQRLVACNKNYEQIIGKPQQWLAKQSIDTILRTFLRRVQFSEGDTFQGRSTWMIKYLDAIEAREKIHSVANVEDGTWYDINSLPVAEGGYVTVATDITSRFLLEKDLERTERQLRQILEGQPFPALVMRSADQEILFTSPAAVEALSGNAKSIGAEKFRHQLNEKPTVIAPIFQAAENQKDPITEVQLKRMSGETFPALFSSQGISYTGTDAEVVSFIDMSAIRNLENELEVQQQALFQSQKLNALGTLLAGVAHELNNPLTVVVANAHVLSMKNKDAETAARVQKITDAAERCSNIVRSFLDVARKSSGDRKVFDPVHCISKSIELTEIGFKGQNINLKTRFEPDLPAIEGDVDQIGQVVMNLLINSRQALSGQKCAKEICVTCRLAPKGDMIELIVSDNGPGVPEAIEDQIFNPFFTTKRIGHGTGMGLSLVHGIVTSHGGTIELLKTEDKGAHFRVRLPHAGTTLTDPNPTLPAPTGRKLKLLLVDDEKDVLEALEDTLIILGHEVLGVTSGKAALETLETQTFDGILSDIRMPEMDGPALYRSLQKKFPEMTNRIAFITGNNMSDSAQAFLTECNCPSLGKPFAPAEVQDLLSAMEVA